MKYLHLQILPDSKIEIIQDGCSLIFKIWILGHRVMTNFARYGLQFNRTGKRKRKKHIINEIKKQVSFYFSDSNLLSDKHMLKLMKANPDGCKTCLTLIISEIQSDSDLVTSSGERVLVTKSGWPLNRGQIPYCTDSLFEGNVPLSTIEQFGRMIELNCGRDLLVKSISFLPELELSPDRESVRRTTTVNPLYNADNRSIYIENLPTKMDHKRLEQALRKYGQAMKISLPRFKNNKELKGFAFVEFRTVQEATAALKGLGWKEAKPELKPFRSPPRSLSFSRSDSVTPNTDTPELSSGTPDVCSETELLTKEAKDEAKKKRRRRRSSVCLADLKSQNRSAELPHSQTSLLEREKRKDPLLLISPTGPAAVTTPTELHHGSLVGSHSARKRKRTSFETESPITDKKVKRVLSLSGPLIDSTTTTATTPTTGAVVVSDTELRKQLKIVKAKRRKKKKIKEKKKCELQDIRVFPKTRWLDLKTLYKSIQKQQMRAIKQDLCTTSDTVPVSVERETTTTAAAGIEQQQQQGGDGGVTDEPPPKRSRDVSSLLCEYARSWPEVLCVYEKRECSG
eukprot:sb/3463465/